MKLYIKQRVFSWRDRFRVYDENENDKYFVEGEIFTFGKKLHLYDNDGYEKAYIHQKLMTLLPKYYISQNGLDIAEVIKKITFFRPEYYVDGFGWDVKGDFLSHEYVISNNERTVATISKRWLTWADTYEIDIEDDKDEIMALCVVLVIDAVIAQINNSAMSN